jgi:hypothetical protein
MVIKVLSLSDITVKEIWIMIYGFINDGICVNIAVFDREPDQDMFSGELVVLQDDFGIGDYYIDNAWNKMKPQVQQDVRKLSYKAVISKGEGGQNPESRFFFHLSSYRTAWQEEVGKKLVIRLCDIRTWIQDTVRIGR